ncbi:hypothetical protein BKA70DRAFT_1414167 [Coprinopsis sp. MPI-PUGE-AT-0042]|nr:hypothetical protein BKA70DRAFT_1414167 [Coprinopsis sp. MPI-PUGE-AT-0042]
MSAWNRKSMLFYSRWFMEVHHNRIRTSINTYRSHWATFATPFGSNLLASHASPIGPKGDPDLKSEAGRWVVGSVQGQPKKMFDPHGFGGGRGLISVSAAPHGFFQYPIFYLPCSSIHLENKGMDYDESSVMLDEKGRGICPRCGTHVKLGTAGKANLLRTHLGKGSCLEAEKARLEEGKRGKMSSTFLGWFKPSAKGAKVPIQVPELPNLQIEASGEQNLEEEDDSATLGNVFTNTDLCITDVRRALQRMVPNLQNPKPGHETDFLSTFDSPAVSFDNPTVSRDEIWEESINRTLHHAFPLGEEIGEADVKGLRSDRVKGFLDFVAYFVDQRGIDEALFEPRMDRLLDALKKTKGSMTYIATLEPLAQTSPISGSTKAEETIVISDTEPLEATPSPSVPCTGYHLSLPAGLTAYDAYPFLIHNTNLSIPWDCLLTKGHILLISWNCEERVQGSRVCSQCSRLAKNNVLQGIISRMKEGVKEGTTYAYYSMGMMKAALRHKTAQSEHYRLRGVTQARRLVAKAAVLADYKRVFNAVASGKVERVDKVIQLGLRQKRGIRGILKQVLKVAEGVYQPKDYQENQSRVPPLIISTRKPTVEEVAMNVEAAFEGMGEALRPNTGASVRHAVLMFDEIATEKRPRWNPMTNEIVGVCRQHGHKVSLEYSSQEDVVELFKAVDEDVVHFSGESTIGAVGVLSDDTRIYGARAVLASGDCKREDATEHAKVLKTTINGVDRHKETTKLRTVCLSSDGNDDLTCDKDWKHVIKRLRNLFLRRKGFVVHGVRITPSIIKAHLSTEGVSAQHIWSILNPNDKQDVKLAFDLLKAIWTLPRTTSSHNPNFLEHLSAASHLSLFLHRTDQKSGIPSLLYIDTQIMIKNTFFCVAKAKVDDPNGKFWLILLGTDRLEELFGMLRTMVGNDANVDLLQLSYRLGCTTEIANILALYPHWDRAPRRLNIPAINRDSTVLPDSSDHLKLRSWRGDVYVKNVTLQTQWVRGRRLVEVDIPEAAVVFNDLEAALNDSPIDMFAPFGDLLVHADFTDEDDDTIEDDEEEGGDEDEDGEALAGAEEDSEARVEVEDAIGDDDGLVGEGEGEEGNRPQRFDKGVLVNGVVISKFKALASYAKYRTVATSRDRLKRVQHAERYTSVPTHKAILIEGPDAASPLLTVHDPIATILCSDRRIWLCVGEVNAITVDGQLADDVPCHLLKEKTVSVSFQLLGLRSTTHDDDPSSMNDWRTYNILEHSFTVPGCAVEVINPDIASHPDAPPKPFYLLDSAFLVSLSASLLGSLSTDEIKQLPKIAASRTFPYVEAETGKSCFLCIDDRDFGTLGVTDLVECSNCDPSHPLDAGQGQRVLEHMAAHIRHDPKVKAVDEPCGLCLRPSPQCRIYLKKGKGAKGGWTIDQRRSLCKNLVRFYYGIAAVSSASSPCTNVPVTCPLCSKDNPAVWKYNLGVHFANVHPNHAGDPTYSNMWSIGNFEKLALKKLWKDRRSLPVVRRKADTYQVVVSDTHASNNCSIALDAPPLRVPVEAIDDGQPEMLDTTFSDGESSDLGALHDNNEAPLLSGQYAVDGGVMAGLDMHSLDPGTEQEGLRGGQRVVEASPSSDRRPSVVDFPPQPASPGLSNTRNARNAISRALGTREDLAAGLEAPQSTSASARPQRERRKRTFEDMYEGDLTHRLCGISAKPTPHGEKAGLVQCSRRACETQWYHLECVSLDVAPKSWACEACKGVGSSKRRK